jgi:hypothetical protein
MGRGQQQPAAHTLLFGRRQQTTSWLSAVPDHAEERQVQALLRGLGNGDWLPVSVVLNRYRDADLNTAPLLAALVTGTAEYIARQITRQIIDSCQTAEVDDGERLTMSRDEHEQGILVDYLRQQLIAALDREPLGQATLNKLADPYFVWLSDEIGPLAERLLEEYRAPVHGLNELSFLADHLRTKSPSLSEARQITLDKLVDAVDDHARQAFEPWGIEDRFSQKAIVLRRKNAGPSVVHLRQGAGTTHTLCGLSLRGGRRLRRGAWSGNQPLYKHCPRCDPYADEVFNEREDDRDRYLVLSAEQRQQIRADLEHQLDHLLSGDLAKIAAQAQAGVQPILVTAIEQRFGDAGNGAERLLKIFAKPEQARLRAQHWSELVALSDQQRSQIIQAWFSGTAAQEIYRAIGANPVVA